MNLEPIVIRSYRWGYILYGGLSAACGAWLVKVALINSNGFMVLDNAFAWIIAALIALFLSGAAVAVDYFMNPPEIRMSMEGLRLLTPGRERFWQWSQIDETRRMSSRAPYVEFRWHPLAGSGSDKARWQSLNFDIPLMAVQVDNMIEAAQKAAATKGDAAEFQRAMEAAKEDYPRLTRPKQALLVAFVFSSILPLVAIIILRHR